jgi:hypothetical protein
MAIVALVLAAGTGCMATDTVTHFPRFTETQSEWLQTHCRITAVRTFEGGTPMAEAKLQLHADVVERLAGSVFAVELVGYHCTEPVPDAIARGE